jgi:hypothetical protein
LQTTYYLKDLNCGSYFVKETRENITRNKYLIHSTKHGQLKLVLPINKSEMYWCILLKAENQNFQFINLGLLI